MKKILLLSNSTNYGEEYMQWCDSIIAFFLEYHVENVVFIPYAAVDFSYSEYTEKVNNALKEKGIVVKNIDDYEDKHEALKKASAILVGGGNTFHLLKKIYEFKLIEIISEQVLGGIPYVGWSAGSNVAGPTICTSNDMPIVYPPSFDGLGLIDVQINPHYTEKTIDGHGGESRKKRLNEYLAANPGSTVICLPESSYLVSAEGTLQYKGSGQGKLLKQKEEIILLDDHYIPVG